MKNKAPWIYKSAKAVLAPIYNDFYHPVIIGAENIPEEGAIILAGNHVHLYDQCNVIIATKRFITYMAKKEYFDNKAVAWFFKGVGCIPVDRGGDTKKSVESALDVLKNGNAIGIFPEGTRNGLKEERVKLLFDKYFDPQEDDYLSLSNMLDDQRPKLSQIYYLEKLIEDEVITVDEFNEYLYDVDGSLKESLKKKIITSDDYYESLLLPFKFGAVSMARKTNALIIPYAITGDYRYHSKDLMIRIGKPLDVSEFDNAEANEKLRSTILDLYKKNLKETRKI